MSVTDPIEPNEQTTPVIEPVAEPDETADAPATLTIVECEVCGRTTAQERCQHCGHIVR